MFLILFFACNETETPVDLKDLCTTVNDGDIDAITTIINSELENYPPDGDAPSSFLGHFENLSAFVTKLNEQTCITATLLCYACLESNPPQSQVSIATSTKTMTIRIVTPENDVMYVSSVY